MKIYEKPLVDVKTFDVEDVMYTSGVFDLNDADTKAKFQEIAGNSTSYTGVVFEW